MELRSLREEGKILETMEAVVIGISFRPPEFNRDLCEKESLQFLLLGDTDRKVIKQYGVWNEQDDCAQRVTLIIDQRGVVRHLDGKVNPATHGKEVVDQLRKLSDGQRVYGSLCERCHGLRGDDLTYPNIKSLRGIAKRHTDKEILNAILSGGFVNVSSLTPEDFDGLIAYVRTL